MPIDVNRLPSAGPRMPAETSDVNMHGAIADFIHNSVYTILLLHCTLSLAAQCIVIGPVCLKRAGRRCVFVALWVCYHDNSK